MLIWGSKNREIVESTGTFYCPECHKKTNYNLKRIGQYFTLYFIPIFETKNLGKYVECSSCKEHFKEKVLSYRNEASHNTENEYLKEKVSKICELTQMHMQLTCFLLEDRIKNISFEELKSYLAFELGVIEYFFGMYQKLAEFEEPQAILFHILNYYCNQKYEKNVDTIMDLWKSLVVLGLMHKQRKLGFDSVNNDTNADGTMKEGHYPGRYLVEALDMET